MGFFDGLLGGAQRDDINEGERRATDAINKYGALGRKTRRNYYRRSVKFLKPQLNAGNAALDKYQTAIGLKGTEAQQAFTDEFINDPGYQEKLEAGNKNVQSNAAARGYLLSGKALKELRDHGHQTLNDEYNNRLDRYERLASSGNETAIAAGNMANNTGADLLNSYMGQGGFLANIHSSAASARANTRFSIGDLAGLIGTAAKAYGAFQ